MTSAHPEDRRAMQLTQGMQQADLDALLPLIHPVLPIAKLGDLRALLVHFFTAAQNENINLLHPPGDFHAWVLRAASLNRGGKPAAINTVRLRLTLLSQLYEHLIDQGLMIANPLRGLPRPEKPKLLPSLPSRAQVGALHQAAKADPPLYATLLLIDQHALNVKELLALTWDDLDLSTPTLRRARTVTPLRPKALAAIEELRAPHGGVFAHLSGPVLPYADANALRRAVFLGCVKAQIPHATPRELRSVSLRDYDHTPRSAGYEPEEGERALERATQLARGISEALTAKAPQANADQGRSNEDAKV